MKISISHNHLQIQIDPSSPDELFAIRRLSDAYFNSAKQVWIIPIRLGISDVLTGIPIFEQIEPLVRIHEHALFAQQQLEGLSIDIHSISAYQALAKAGLEHLQTVHFGNITVYNENHPNYKEISNETANNRRQKNQVRLSKNAKTKTSDKGKRKGSEARRRAVLDR